MGLITAVLSYVMKIHKLVTGLRQKDTNPNYNADTDSNEAIRDAVNGVQSTADNTYTAASNAYSEIVSCRNDVAALNDVSELQVLNKAKEALSITIPDAVQANSVYNILDDQLRPRLPGSGTLSTETSAVQSCKDALNYTIPANNANSVWDILMDQLRPRLPATGTIATTDDVGGRGEFEHVISATYSMSYITLCDITGSGILYSIAVNTTTGSSGVKVKITIDGIVLEVYTDDMINMEKHWIVTYPGAYGLGVSDKANNLNFEYQDGLKVELERGYGDYCGINYHLCYAVD